MNLPAGRWQTAQPEEQRWQGAGVRGQTMKSLFILVEEEVWFSE